MATLEEIMRGLAKVEEKVEKKESPAFTEARKLGAKEFVIKFDCQDKTCKEGQIHIITVKADDIIERICHMRDTFMAQADMEDQMKVRDYFSSIVEQHLAAAYFTHFRMGKNFPELEDGAKEIITEVEKIWSQQDELIAFENAPKA